ncbi:MAG: Ig-like domain-containing protein [Oscillospiraceae bacterium]|nr:Ig-like domain-containing protein [Oscillospiraceae bacterium]
MKMRVAKCKATAAILSLSLILQLFPMSLASAPVREALDAGGAALQPARALSGAIASAEAELIPYSPITAEVVELRGESEKHFRRADGTFLAVSYGEPVHYLDKEAGQWQELNTGFVVERDEAGGEVYAVTALPNPVRLPESFDEGRMVTLGAGEFEIGFGVSSLNEGVNWTARAEPLAAEDTLSAATPLISKEEAPAAKTESAVRTQDEAAIAVEPQESAAAYADVFEGVDLEYFISPGKLKESIVVKQPGDAYRYIFDLWLGNLIPEPQEDGSIVLLHPQNADELVAVLEAPFMMDAAGAYSDAVTLELVEQDGFYLLTVDADPVWINAEDRVWPVLIDPTVTVLNIRTESAVKISFIKTDSATAKTVGRDDDDAQNQLCLSRAYLQLYLPTLPANSTPIKATYAATLVNGYAQTSADPSYRLYASPSIPTTWSSQPFGDSPNSFLSSSELLIDYAEFPAASGASFPVEWDFTRIARSGYENGQTFVDLMLCKQDETQEGYLSFPTSVTDYGSITVAYTSNYGLEDYWSYETLDLGRSGTVSINHYNGSMTYEHIDFEIGGSRLPFELKHIHTGVRPYNKVAFSRFSDGMESAWAKQPFSMNIMEYLVKSGDDFILVDGDGTEKIFKRTTPYSFYYTCEDDENLLLTCTGIPIILEDGQGTKKYFGYDQTSFNEYEGFTLRLSACYQLFRIEDANGNALRIYEGGQNQYTIDNEEHVFHYFDVLRRLTDAAGREYTFEYYHLNVIQDSSGVWNHTTTRALNAIVDPAGKRIEFDSNYHDNTNPNKQMTITYPDGRTTHIETSGNIFNVSGGDTKAGSRIDRIEAADGSEAVFTYASNDPLNNQFQRVISYQHLGPEKANNTRDILEEKHFSYQSGATKVTDALTSDYNSYIFDYVGRVVNSWDQDYLTTYTKYNSEGNLNHKVSTVSEPQPLLRNLARNHSFEFGGGWTPDPSNTGIAAITDTQAFSGEKSMQLSNPAQSTTAVTQTYANGIIEAGQSYTLSAYVKLPDTLAAANGGARLVLRAENTTGDFVEDSSEWITDAMDWTRYDTAISVPGHWTGTITIAASLKVEDAGGIAFFDAVQLEPNACMNDYNLLENPLFDYIDNGLPEYWTPFSLDNNDQTAYDNTGLPGNYMHINGQLEQEKRLAQTVTVNAKAGQNLVFNAYATAYASEKPDSLFGVVLDAGPNGIAYAPFSETAYSHLQAAGGSIRLTQNVEAVTLTLVYDNNINTAAFKGASLHIGNFGESYEYYGSGLLKEFSDDLGNSTHIQYDGDSNPHAIQKKHDGVITDSAEISYDGNHNITNAVINGVDISFDYGGYGAVTGVTVVGEDGLIAKESMTYTPDYNYPATYTDARGLTTSYSYDPQSGQLLSVTDPRGNVIAHSYDANTGELLSTAGGASASTSYSYLSGLLQSVQQGDLAYHFDYDLAERSVAVRAGSTSLAESSYDHKNQITERSYANGGIYQRSYDGRGRLIGETYSDAGASGPPALAFSYAYNQKNQLIRQNDYADNQSWSYDYDQMGRPSVITGSNGTQTRMTYNDKTNTISRLTASRNGDVITDTEYLHASDGRPLGTVLHSLDGAAVNYSYDMLKRLTQKDLMLPGGMISSTSIFTPGPGGRATGLVSRYTNESVGAGPLQQWNYSYDGSGNLIKATDLAGGITNYAYDSLNRLTAENDIVYTYSNHGNITSVTQGNVAVHSYSYENTERPDQLTAIDGFPISYDDFGNPLTFNGYSFVWQKGDQLAGVSGNGLSISYTYDAKGNRTSRTVNGSTYNYSYAGGLLISQTGPLNLNFAYDESGKMIGFRYNGASYFYLRDLQENVVAVVDDTGALAAEYAYDAYGNLTSHSGPMSIINPIRYRGYYQDLFTGWYYIENRYYNPDLRRWLSPALPSVDGNALTGINSYAYCGNNPIPANARTGVFEIMTGENGLFQQDRNAPVSLILNWMQHLFAGGSYSAAVTGVEITLPEEKHIAVFAGETRDGVVVHVEPAGTNQYVLWSSADESVATVDFQGVITGIKEGITTVTVASAVDSGKTDTIRVCVITPFAHDIIGVMNSAETMTPDPVLNTYSGSVSAAAGAHISIVGMLDNAYYAAPPGASTNLFVPKSAVDLDLRWPVPGRSPLTNRWDWRLGPQLRRSIEIVDGNISGEPAVAVISGVVDDLGDDYIVLRHVLPGRGTFCSSYANLSAVEPLEHGAYVKAGDPVGNIDSVGLRFEIWRSYPDETEHDWTLPADNQPLLSVSGNARTYDLMQALKKIVA